MGGYGTVVSDDGTPISVLSTGSGPGLVILPGNNRRAHHYTALAAELSGYPVHTVERRGRGASGPQGTGYTIDSEVADALAVIRHTGSSLLFGHSYGGLVAMHVAIRHSLAALAVYEPGVSINGSIDTSWHPEFRRLLDAGRRNAAMATFLRRSRLTPVPDVPMVVFRALAYLLLHGSDGRDTAAMMSTTPAELAEVARLDSDGGRYAGIDAPTLLLGGGKTPPYITGVLPQLARIIPTARYTIVPELDHNAPDLNAPALVAEQVKNFVAAARVASG